MEITPDSSWADLRRVWLLGAALAVGLPMPQAHAQEPSRTPAHEHRVAEQASSLIPSSVRAEHEEIQGALQHATRAEDPVGLAARELQRVLQPHFEREEQIALPPLGLLRPLATRAARPDELTAGRVLAMSDSLRAELPRMLAEHTRIRSAVIRLAETARAHRDPQAAALAERLQLHARNEEEVMYPAAILVGEVLRQRGRSGANESLGSATRVGR